MTKKEKIMLVVVDMQRGFMPEEEGARLGLEGFGELPIAGGQEIIPKINQAIAWAKDHGVEVAASGDAHPPKTAHFDMWPVHAVDGTPGAMLHPDVEYDGKIWKKGMEVLEKAEDDDSYTAGNAKNPETGESLVEYMKNKDITRAVVVGLAVLDGEGDVCVDSTVRTLLNEGVSVWVANDATCPIVPGNLQAALEKLESLGATVASTDEVLKLLS